jgi:hypothetical protein
MALTKEQSNWMYKKLDALYQKYYLRLPFNQNTWNEFMEDIKALDTTCKGSVYTDGRDMIFAMAEYFDKLNAKGYKGDGLVD